MTVFSYANSDGTSHNLMANPKRALFTPQGQVLEDTMGMDFIVYSRPLGERYLVTGYCLSAIEEFSQVKDGLGLTGWSQGKFSKLPVAPGWACGHVIANSSELIGIQIALSVLTLAFILGDFFVMIEGFRGVLQGQPVLTYAILSGLERRRLLLVCIVLNALPALLYMDVSRIYYFTENGFKIWCLSCIVMANFFSFGLVLLVSLIDLIPFRFNYVFGYSSLLFLSGAIAAVSIICCREAVFLAMYNKYYGGGTPLITMQVNGVDWPSGSYTAAGTPPVLTYLMEQILLPLFVALATSASVSAILHKINHHTFMLHIEWCKTNGFLVHAGVPNFMTSLPLEQVNAIKLGSKSYCKPSTQALLGYSSVIDADPAAAIVPIDPTKHYNPIYHVISIYAAFFVFYYGTNS
ncbi:hypothetical protein AeMF1_020635 [Aphanomyces euteiches]|nr:hypothetical protein AeMF1_020635 [Aphanomyces euteiches]KAH9166743.1 hypothetical protein AeNC1_018282 [Aphanomyces euteiches]